MPALWRPAYVAVGGNLDQPRDRVVAAFDRIDALPDTRLELLSRLYASHPMGPQDQPDYVNAVAGIVTRLQARELLEALLGIERDMGRERRERWGSRVIDLDLIWITGERVDEPGLTLPHPGVSERNFVLYPLCDIAPALRIPGLGLIQDLAARVADDGISLLETL